MSISINKVTLLGHMGRDPEVRHTPQGSKIVNLNLATSDSWVDRSTQERRESTEWHRVVIFNEKLADIAERMIKKGTRIYVEGKIQNRKWVDASGQNRYATDIIIPRFGGELIILDRVDASQGNANFQRSSGGLDEGQPSSDFHSHGDEHDQFSDDEIPF